MKLNLRPTMDLTPEVKRIGIELSDKDVILTFTTVTNASAEISMTNDEWIQLSFDVARLRGT